jgi:hypothetical protein
MSDNKQGRDEWVNTLAAWLPLLALAAPLSLFASALVRATGAATLPGELFWVSAYEAPIAGIGMPFFPATFIFLGKAIAGAFPKTGVTVTLAGTLGTGFMVFIIAYRGLVAGYVDKGIDPSLLADFMFTGILPFFPVMNIAFFIAWIAAGVAILRSSIGPWWCGWLMLLGIFCIPISQAAYYKIEIFYPLGTGLLALSVGVLAFSGDDSGGEGMY